MRKVILLSMLCVAAQGLADEGATQQRLLIDAIESNDKNSEAQTNPPEFIRKHQRLFETQWAAHDEKIRDYVFRLVARTEPVLEALQVNVSPEWSGSLNVLEKRVLSSRADARPVLGLLATTSFRRSPDFGRLLVELLTSEGTLYGCRPPGADWISYSEYLKVNSYLFQKVPYPEVVLNNIYLARERAKVRDAAQADSSRGCHQWVAKLLSPLFLPRNY